MQCCRHSPSIRQISGHRKGAGLHLASPQRRRCGNRIADLGEIGPVLALVFRLQGRGHGDLAPERQPGRQRVAAEGPGCDDPSISAFKGGDVVVVPKRQVGIGTVVRCGTDRTVFGADNTPATLGLHPAQGRAGLRALPAEAGGMRGLVDAVRDDDRSDPHRFEQDVVAGITGHRTLLVELS